MRTFAYTNIAKDGDEFDSSSIDFVYYDRHRNVLGIEFQSSETIYAYRNVAESVYNLLVEADSVGAFYTRNIKDRFDGDGTYDEAVKRLLPEDAVSAPADHSSENAWEKQEPPLADWERELLEGPGEEVPDPAYSKFSVRWVGSFNQSDERMGPFEFFTDATSPEDAIQAFWTTAKNLHGDAVTAKIVSVTHYFE